MGTTGKVVGFADFTGNLVILEVTVDIAGTSQTISNTVTSRNLCSSSEYSLEHIMEQPEEASAITGPADKPAKKAWLVGSSAPDDVHVEDSFKDLLIRDDAVAGSDVTRLARTKAHLLVCLEALQQILPTFTDKDLLVANRKSSWTSHGVWKTEVWTKREFGPRELVFAPMTTQLKETNITAAAHSLVRLPKHGPGAHAHNSSVSLDGRGRTVLASRGPAGGTEAKTGSFYWAIGRTSDPAEANLIYEEVPWEQNLALDMPKLGAQKKRRRTEYDWPSNHLPVLAIMVNAKAVPKQTQLLVYQPKKD